MVNSRNMTPQFDNMNISCPFLPHETPMYNPCIETPLKGVYNPPINRDFTALNVAGIDDELMYMIIGKDGIVFKAISHQTGVDYIFWLKEQKMIAVWGWSDSLPYAVRRLEDRIHLVLNNFR